MRVTMTLQVRAIRPEESDVLSYWQRADNVVCYRRARIVRLAEKGWKAEEVAEALGLHVDIVRQTIKDFNKGGVSAITPQPRSGGRPGSRPTPKKWLK